IRRAGTARGHRAGDRRRPEGPGGRRADRRPRRAERRGDPHAHGDSQPRVQEDDRHGHSRSPRLPARPYPETPRQGSPEGWRMKFLPYVLKHLRRNWLRTACTVLAMSVCIFLFCTLRTFVVAVTLTLPA